jgi:hypothetical protein
LWRREVIYAASPHYANFWLGTAGWVVEVFPASCITTAPLQARAHADGGGGYVPLLMLWTIRLNAVSEIRILNRLEQCVLKTWFSMHVTLGIT